MGLFKYYLRPWEALKHFCVFIVAIYTFSNVVGLFFGEHSRFFIWLQNILQNCWIPIFLILFIIALIITKPLLSIKSELANDIEIEIKVSDIFKSKSNCVIGVGSTFDTAVPSIVSETSLFGQFIKKYYPSPHLLLNPHIEKKLENEHYELLTDNRTGNKKQYDIGIVVQVPTGASKNQRNFYLLVTNHTNKYGNVENAKFGDISDALLKLWLYITSQRQDFDNEILIPLLGTKYFKLPIRKEDVIIEIINSFITCCSQQKICNKLVIVISPEDYKNSKINLTQLKGILDYRCKAGMHNLSSQVEQSLGIS